MGASPFWPSDRALQFVGTWLASFSARGLVDPGVGERVGDPWPTAIAQIQSLDQARDLLAKWKPWVKHGTRAVGLLVSEHAGEDGPAGLTGGVARLLEELKRVRAEVAEKDKLLGKCLTVVEAAGLWLDVHVNGGLPPEISPTIPAAEVLALVLRGVDPSMRARQIREGK